MTSQRNGKHVEDYQGLDRLSDLPDEIRCHILSFMPSKSAHKMSILSKQWKLLWTKIPVLDFTEMPNSIKYYELTSQQKIDFKNFVHKVLLHNDVHFVQRLQLCFGPDDNNFCISSWLNAITKRDIQEIEIKFPSWSHKPLILPTKFLSRGGLVVLKLNGNFAVNDSMSLHLPNLEIVHFNGLQNANDEFMKRLSSGCPVLKELFIIQCSGINSTLYVESVSLRRLHITRIENTTKKECIVIKAPNLRYLYLVDTSMKQYVIGDLSSLIEASLDLVYDSVDNVLQVLQSVSKVKTLRLKNPPERFGYVSKLPAFENLTCLKLDNAHKFCTFLGCAPNLKYLTFTEVGSADKSYESKPVPMCLSSLESFHIYWFESSERELALLAYILKYGSMLKKMEIHMYIMSRKCERDAYQSLLMLPRSSSACLVKVISHFKIRKCLCNSMG